MTATTTATAATTTTNSDPARALYLAFDTGAKNWTIRFGDGDRERERTIPAGDLPRLTSELAQARARFHLPPTAPTYSCYEAGRDGFWLHRCLFAQGVTNEVIDAASIEVDRRARHVKTDRRDAQKLLRLLLRHQQHGESEMWRACRVPTVAEEDERRLHRERQTLLGERVAHESRIVSVLRLEGCVIQGRAIRTGDLTVWRNWDGQPLSPGTLAAVARERERLRLVDTQLAALEQERDARLATPQTRADQVAQALFQVREVGLVNSWVLSKEFFGWRRFANRRQVGAAAGLTGTPYASGTQCHEQGISKAGNWRVRVAAVQLAWAWLRFQPDSALSQWYQRRWGRAGKRQRLVGIVALARRVLIALWRYLETGALPPGTRLKRAPAQVPVAGPVALPEPRP